MTQADGLQKNETARKPRALPWAGMNQAFGLRAPDTISSSQRVRTAMWVETGVEALGYSRMSLATTTAGLGIGISERHWG
jgi:hypothetical protein